MPSDIAFETSDSQFRYVCHHYWPSDNSNNEVLNNPLSFDYAASTRDYLLRKRVYSQRIHINGWGSHEPISTDDTAASGAINRCVEIYVFEL